MDQVELLKTHSPSTLKDILTPLEVAIALGATVPAFTGSKVFIVELIFPSDDSEKESTSFHGCYSSFSKAEEGLVKHILRSWGAFCLRGGVTTLNGYHDFKDEEEMICYKGPDHKILEPMVSICKDRESAIKILQEYYLKKYSTVELFDKYFRMGREYLIYETTIDFLLY